MSQQILQVDQAMLETTLDRMVRKSVEETLNAMLDAEADEITGAARYERSGERKAYRAGHYERDLTVKAGKMSLKVPKLKGAVFESAVIERYRRREESVEEALMKAVRGASLLTATASATAFVPAANASISNTPIGPFQNTVCALAMASA